MVTPFSRAALCRLLSGTVLVAGLSAGSSPLEAARPSPPSEGAFAAQAIWNALLTHCPSGSYFYTGSSLDRGGMLADIQVGKNPVLEFKGVTFHSVRIPTSAAERENGIAFRARLTMVAHLYREAGDSWSDGPDQPRRNMGDIVAHVLADANSDFFGMGGNGSMTIQLVKFKGRWAFARGSTDFSGGFGASSGFQLLDEFVKKPAPRYSCKDGQVLAPPVSARAQDDRDSDGQ